MRVSDLLSPKPVFTVRILYRGEEIFLFLRDGFLSVRCIENRLVATTEVRGTCANGWTFFVLGVFRAFGVSLYTTRLADFRLNGPIACRIFCRFSSVILPVLIPAGFAVASTISRHRSGGYFLAYLVRSFGSGDPFDSSSMDCNRWYISSATSSKEWVLCSAWFGTLYDRP